ncbi:MAG: hypothetical protein KBA71_04970 [Opitutaceae bacterium]|nr:hypothetical protein [Opitutaceae bacterium]
MRNRRIFYAVALLAAAVAMWYFGQPRKPAPPAPTAAVPSKAPVFPSPSSSAIANLPPDSVPRVAEGAAAVEDATFEGIDQLNASGKSIHDDLRLLNDLFASWQVTFPHGGNPFGSNADITRALTGDNKFHIAMIPKRHPAINAAGELVDRWGTPFFFHQLSGTRMEIRSAGPDRKLYTPDDTVLSPEPVP